MTLRLLCIAIARASLLATGCETRELVGKEVRSYLEKI